MSMPPASGVRLEWNALPLHLRAAVEGWFGEPVVEAVTQPGGFSPGVAARLRTGSGQRAFVKAVGPEPNPDSVRFHRREQRIAGALPAEAPAPHLLWSYDGGEGGWVALLYEDIAGWQPQLPWRDDELDRVLAALVDLSTALTPSPVPATIAGTIGDEGIFRAPWWGRMVDAPPPTLDPWAMQHLDTLAALEMEAGAAAVGETLLHLDLRADNILLTPERVVVVDWPHARIGAAWVDIVFLAPSVAMQGGPDPAALFARHPSSNNAPLKAVTAVIALMAGFLTWSALQPPPPGLPTLRAFQDAQGTIARRWLAERMDIGPMHSTL